MEREFTWKNYDKATLKKIDILADCYRKYLDS